MTDISQILIDTLKKLSEITTVEILDKNRITWPALAKFYQVWSVVEEISDKGKCTLVKLYICFTRHFPFEFPHIYISKEDNEKYKYIPHIDDNLFICTFDPNLSRPDPEDPYNVIFDTLIKAKEIIEKGINGHNEVEFISEFNSYWICRYDNEPKINLAVLQLFEGKPLGKLALIVMAQNIQGYKYVICQEGSLRDNFLNFVEKNKITYKEIEPFYFELKENEWINPPFCTSNSQMINVISSLGPDQLKIFQQYINHNTSPKLILFHNKTVNLLLGAFVGDIVTDRKGFRPGSLSKYAALSTFHKNDKLTRISPTIYTNQRLHNRSAGSDFPEDSLKFCIAGLGSIGSNIVYFLNTLSFPNFKFLDPDILLVENIGRHFLGMEYVNMNKAHAIATFIQNNNPIQKVAYKDKSILDICDNDISFLNEADFIFICIGSTNINLYLIDLLKKGEISSPMFFVWVEPFLAGGHCLYIHPQDNTFDKYFEDDLFKFNIIDRTEYSAAKHKFAKNELGCRTSYIPYSLSNTTSFLSSLFPKLISIIHNKQSYSTSFTWVGGIEDLKIKDVIISKYGSSLVSNQLIENCL